MNQCEYCSDFIEYEDVEDAIKNRMLNGKLYCKYCWENEIN